MSPESIKGAYVGRSDVDDSHIVLRENGMAHYAHTIRPLPLDVSFVKKCVANMAPLIIEVEDSDLGDHPEPRLKVLDEVPRSIGCQGCLESGALISRGVL